MPDFLLPDLGEGLAEAEVIAWRVKPGDRVTVDQVIAEVETAKAVVEVPVPYAGGVAGVAAGPAAEDAAARGAPGGDEEASGSVLIGYGTGSGTAPTRSRRGRR